MAMAFLRRLVQTSVKSKPAPAVISPQPAMDSQVESITKQTEALSVSDDYNPDTVAYEFGCAPGVLRTRVGFTGGKKKNPTYYSLGDHTETVEIQYDPKKTNYSEMLKLFWTNHDPTRCASRQYMSAIFYHDKEQKRLAEQTKEEEAKKRQKKIQTRVVEAETFYNAEDYHQKYLLRQQRDILQALNLSDEELVRSHAACRLNGYCGGYGKVNELEKEMPRFNISADAQQRVRILTQKGAQM